MALEQKLSLLPPLPPPVAFPDSGLDETLFPGILDVSPLNLPHLCSRPGFPFPDILEGGPPSCLLALLPFPYLPFLLLLHLVPSPAKPPSPLPSSRPPWCSFSSSPPSKRFHLLVVFAKVPLLLSPLPASCRPPSLPPVCSPQKTSLFPASPPTAFPPCSSDQPSSAAAAAESPTVVVERGQRPC